MKKISDLLKKGERCFSFEFFPPKTFVSSLALGAAIGELKTLNPSFVSVTYGAGGSTHQNTFDLVAYIQERLEIPAMAHYTCVGATEEQMKKSLLKLKEKNVLNLMALRGDPPKGEKTFQKIAGGFRYASELISLARDLGGFSIGCAGYPEGHPEATSLEDDLTHLKEKVDSGADFIVTQMFFINDFYFDFVDRARKAGIDCPILPGIMPITNLTQIERFSKMCGATIPPEVSRSLSQTENEEERQKKGIDFAQAQCRDLLERGAPGLHFYTLNKSRATRDIFKNIQTG